MAAVILPASGPGNMEFRVQALGFRAWGFVVRGSGFKGLAGLRVWGSGLYTLGWIWIMERKLKGSIGFTHLTLRMEKNQMERTWICK